MVRVIDGKCDKNEFEIVKNELNKKAHKSDIEVLDAKF
jgi:hypothetical protein